MWTRIQFQIQFYRWLVDVVMVVVAVVTIVDVVVTIVDVVVIVSNNF